MKKRFITILIHTITWAVFFFVPFLIAPDLAEMRGITTTSYVQLFFSIHFFILFCFFYFNFFLLMPRLLNEGKYWRYIFSVMLTGAFIIFILSRLRIILLYQLLQQAPIGGLDNRLWAMPFILTFILTLAVSSGLWLLQKWQRIEQKLAVSEKERLAAELNQLKSQLNPHFLFNTLNGIYTLALLKSDLTPEAVLKLSNLMRYVLTDAGEDFVPLEKDLNHLRHFIALNKMRLTEKSPIDFEIIGQTQHLNIAPLLLLPFVENAFQYGVSNAYFSPIKIKIQIAEKKVTFYCENLILDKSDAKHKQHGIGIANTRRRLELVYSGQHQLEVSRNETHFFVRLTIELF
jgi:two-component system, LytTR family, sensor kinase